MSSGMTFKKLDRIVADVCVEVLSPCGFSFSQHTGGKHKYILVERDGHTSKVPYSGSPRSDNIANYTRQALQRCLRDWSGPQIINN